ncbi:MAG: hypothetical protein AB7L92_00730 [Alphaproteobacteria bacterium]
MENRPEKVQEAKADVAMTAVDAALPDTIQPKPVVPIEHEKTTGEKIHKWGTYLGVDWVLNTALGVGFAYWGKVTKSGQMLWSKPWNKVFDKALFFVKNPESRAFGVHKGNMFVSIIAGGMFTIPPLMALENRKNKKAIVQSLDRMIYGEEKVASDPKFQQAYDAIDMEPEKDFKAGMTSRFAALAPLLTLTVFIPSSRDWLEKNYFRHISKASENAATKMGIKGAGLKKIMAGREKDGTPISAWKFIHDNVAFDGGQALPYAGIHAIFYNMFARGNKKGELADTSEASHEMTLQKPGERPTSGGFADKEDYLQGSSHAVKEMARKAEAEIGTHIRS